MSGSSVQCILLTQKAEVKSVKLSYTGPTVTAKDIQTALKKKETAQKLGDYKYKGLLLSLYGYTKGRAGTENKHELPPPHDSILAFGDILVVATGANAKPTAFKPEEYETFYTKMFGGFDDIDSEDSDTEDEEEIQGVEEDAEEIAEDENEEDEEEEDEEDEEESNEGEDEFEANEEEQVVQPRAQKAPKKKKAAPSLLVAQTGASQIIHVPQNELLTEESEELSPEREKFIEILRGMLEGTPIPPEELEHGVFKATVQEAQRRHVTCHWKNVLFQHIYQTKTRQVVGNLLPESYVANKSLLHDLKTGKYTLEEICKFDAYKLSNDMWKDFFHRRQQQEKRQLEGNKAMATDQFLCTRCHKRECTYYEMQTRSADEPMTIFITCMNCGKHWRQ